MRNERERERKKISWKIGVRLLQKKEKLRAQWIKIKFEVQNTLVCVSVWHISMAIRQFCAISVLFCAHSIACLTLWLIKFNCVELTQWESTEHDFKLLISLVETQKLRTQQMPKLK